MPPPACPVVLNSPPPRRPQVINGYTWPGIEYGEPPSCAYTFFEVRQAAARRLLRASRRSGHRRGGGARCRGPCRAGLLLEPGSPPRSPMQRAQGTAPAAHAPRPPPATRPLARPCPAPRLCSCPYRCPYRHHLQYIDALRLGQVERFKQEIEPACKLWCRSAAAAAARPAGSWTQRPAPLLPSAASMPRGAEAAHNPSFGVFP